MAIGVNTWRGDRNPARDIVVGVGAGLVGGLVFGALMAMMGMLPMIGMLVGREDATVGFALHMPISALIGAIYGAFAGGIPAARRPVSGLLIGLLYGAVWWVLGPLLMMPTMMGMGPQFGAAFTQMNLMSLVGHLMYGAILGGTFALLSRAGRQESRNHVLAGR